MFTLEDALGEMVAWDADYCIVPTDGSIPEDIAPKSPGTSIRNKCKLMDYSTNDQVIAEGRFQTREPKALVNGLPLGPNAMKVYVDVVVNPKAYLWRPTVNMRNVEDSLNCFVAWPANRVVMETTPESPPLQPSTSKASSTGYQNEKSPVTPKAPVKKPATTLKAARASPRRKLQPVAFKENQKCKLMDLIRKNHVVAEGCWSSNNPASVVHFVPLGPNACRVWVDVVKDKDAAVWRRSSEIEYMEDAFGTSIAWPEDKVEPLME